MTDERGFDRRLIDVLDEWPTVAPDRLLSSVLDGVQTAPQRPRRPSVLGWRRPGSNVSWRPLAAFAAVAAVVAVIALGQIIPRPGISGPGSSSSPRTSPSAAPSATRATFAASYEVMAPGRYYMPEPNTDGVGRWPVRVIVTVPLGWTQHGPARGGAILKGAVMGQSADPETAVASLTFGRIGSFDDGTGGCPVPSLSPGLTVDDLTTSLRPASIDRQVVLNVWIADAAIGEYHGKRVDFEIKGLGCQALRGWSTPPGGEQWKYHWSAGSHHQLSILDVNGVRFLIDASYAFGSSQELKAEVQSIVDSIEFE